MRPARRSCPALSTRTARVTLGLVPPWDDGHPPSDGCDSRPVSSTGQAFRGNDGQGCRTPYQSNCRLYLRLLARSSQGSVNPSEAQRTYCPIFKQAHDRQFLASRLAYCVKGFLRRGISTARFGACASSNCDELAGSLSPHDGGASCPTNPDGPDQHHVPTAIPSMRCRRVLRPGGARFRHDAPRPH